MVIRTLRVNCLFVYMGNLDFILLKIFFLFRWGFSTFLSQLDGSWGDRGLSPQTRTAPDGVPKGLTRSGPESRVTGDEGRTSVSPDVSHPDAPPPRTKTYLPALLPGDRRRTSRHHGSSSTTQGMCQETRPTPRPLFNHSLCLPAPGTAPL